MWRFLGHWLGLDNASGPPYLFWSGFFGDVSILAVPFIVWRRHNCHAHGCWRVGRFPVDGTPYTTCRRHHPDGPATAGQIADAHADARQEMTP